jgi:hypothetical protein
LRRKASGTTSASQSKFGLRLRFINVLLARRVDGSITGAEAGRHLSELEEE